jgi:hypothetical protein
MHDCILEVHDRDIQDSRATNTPRLELTNIPAVKFLGRDASRGVLLSHERSTNFHFLIYRSLFEILSYVVYPDTPAVVFLRLRKQFSHQD